MENENDIRIQLSGDDEKDKELIKNLNDQLRGITPRTVPVKEILRITNEYVQTKNLDEEAQGKSVINDPSNMNNKIGKNNTEAQYDKYREKIMKEREDYIRENKDYF